MAGRPGTTPTSRRSFVGMLASYLVLLGGTLVSLLVVILGQREGEDPRRGVIAVLVIFGIIAVMPILFRPRSQELSRGPKRPSLWKRFRLWLQDRSRRRRRKKRELSGWRPKAHWKRRPKESAPKTWESSEPESTFVRDDYDPVEPWRTAGR